MTKNLLLFALIFLCASCRMPDNFGFYQPLTMSMEAPDGPPEFKAGWYSGCKSALASRVGFANAYVYGEGKGPEFMNGIYQHDSMYQTGWSSGWSACAIYVGHFSAYHSMRHGPLE